MEGVTSRLVVALDFSSFRESLEFLESLKQTSLIVKVGLQLYLQNGPSVLGELRRRGYRIFLDLKLHDIPNTVYQAVKGLMKFDLEFLTIHAAGGEEMVRKAVEAVRESQKPCKIICVTQLTSKEEVASKSQSTLKSLGEEVVELAETAQKAGADGVVCSVWEVGRVRRRVGTSLLVVTPGIRLKNQETQDQKRVGSPREAKAQRSDFIVVGRALRLSKNPRATLQRIKQEFEGE